MLCRCLLWTDQEEVDGAFFRQLEEASCSQVLVLLEGQHCRAPAAQEVAGVH